MSWGGYSVQNVSLYGPDRETVTRLVFEVRGPGMLTHDVPRCNTAFEAECVARNMARAFEAGKKARSAEIKRLIND